MQKREEKNIGLFWARLEIVGVAAIPIVIAVTGYFLQKSNSEESIKKDYVQIAINVLSQKETISDIEIRNELGQWAIKVLSKNSPIEFSESLERNLLESKAAAVFSSTGNLTAGRKGLDFNNNPQWLRPELTGAEDIVNNIELDRLHQEINDLRKELKKYQGNKK